MNQFVKILKFSNLENLHKNRQILKVSINICFNALYENLRKNNSVFGFEKVIKEELIIFLMIWLNLDWGDEF